MQVPTKNTCARLLAEFQSFSKQHGLIRGVDQAFARSLATKPKLLAAFRYLEVVIPNKEFRRRVLRGHNPLYHTCSLCGKAMCGTKDVCSNACVEKEVATVASAGWAFVAYKYRHGRITRATLRCASCGKQVTKDLYAIRCGYSCACRRADKISEARRAHRTPAMFISEVRRLRIPIELLTPYQGFSDFIQYRCTRCGDVGLAKPKRILQDKFCLICNAHKAKAAYMEKHGVAHPNQRADVKSRKSATMVARYGAPHALQSPALLTKMQNSSYSRKEFLLGRRKVLVQGYEPQALDWLLHNTPLRPKDIFCGNDSKIPVVRYTNAGAEHRYHPDIYIPKHNLIIEVKSNYSYARNERVTKLKKAACKAAGYNFMLLVMAKNGERLNGN